SHAPKCRVRCEQDENSAITCPGEIVNDLRNRCVVRSLIFARVRNVIRKTKQAMIGIGKGRRKDFLDCYWRVLAAEREARSERGEVSTCCKRCTRERDGFEPIKQESPEERSEIERHG